MVREIKWLYGIQLEFRPEFRSTSEILVALILHFFLSFDDVGFQVAADWSRACFSPDSEYITVGAANGKIYIWSVHDNSKPETVLPEHSAPVLAAAWQPAGNSLTTCDKNKTVVVWAAI